MRIPPNGRFIGENPIKMDDLGLPPVVETPHMKSGDLSSRIGGLTAQNEERHGEY